VFPTSITVEKNYKNPIFCGEKSGEKLKPNKKPSNLNNMRVFIDI
jgi:hypothetical protein